MKKTLITLLALAGVVAATETTQSVTATLFPTDTPAWQSNTGSEWTQLTWPTVFKNTSSAEEAAYITTAFRNLGITGSGCYVFNEKGTTDGSTGLSLSDEGVLTLPGKSDASGAIFYATIVSVSDVLQGYDFDSLNSITLNLTGNTGNSNDTYFGVYTMNSEGTLTTIVGVGENGTLLTQWNTNTSKSYSIDSSKLASTDNVVLLIRHSYAPQSGVNSMTLTDVSATASINVPEPTTATLSLLALAGLAARRRRK